MQQTAQTRSDREIIEQILAGSVNLFDQIITRYREHVAKIVRRHVPPDQLDEVSHEVFIRTYQALPTLKQRDDVKPWLSSIAVRACYDFWRERYRKREIPLSALTEQQQHWLENSMAANASQSFFQDEDQHAAHEVLDWALQQLSAEDRMVVELVYLEGLTGKEAAQLLGWSVANVKIRSFRARQKLHKLLTKRGFSQRGDLRARQEISAARNNV